MFYKGCGYFQFARVHDNLMFCEENREIILPFFWEILDDKWYDGITSFVEPNRKKVNNCFNFLFISLCLLFILICIYFLSCWLLVI